MQNYTTRTLTIEISTYDDDERIISIETFSKKQQKQLLKIILQEINDMIKSGIACLDDMIESGFACLYDDDRKRLLESLVSPICAINEHDICVLFNLNQAQASLYDKLMSVEVTDGFFSAPVDIEFDGQDLLLTIT